MHLSSLESDEQKFSQAIVGCCHISVSSYSELFVKSR